MSTATVSTDPFTATIAARKTADLPVIACQMCRHTFTGTESEARAVRWTVWTGTTMSGREVRVVYCHRHTDENGDAVESGFDAECFTCGEKASDGEFDGTEEDAEAWMDDHVCEPDMRLIKPKVFTL